MIKNLVQYTRGFTKRTFISEALTSLATLAISTATTTRKEAGHGLVNQMCSTLKLKDYMWNAKACVYA